MTRRCSHCSNNGHNSRTCPARGGGVRLFGVRLTEGWAAGAMKKSASMGCLPSSAAAASAASPTGDALGDPHRHRSAAAAAGASGYASDDPTRASCSSNCRNERKKGVPWTEDEHRMFLMGLQKLGKGDWRGIARNFVISRTPTQVASHAQKYFIRQSNASRRKRRSSLFDMVPEMPIDQVIPSTHEELFLPHSPNQQGAHEPIEPSTASHSAEQSESSNQLKNSVSELPAFHPALMPVPFWPTSNLTTPAEDEAMAEPHDVVKSIPVAQRHVDEVVSMSELRIGEGAASQIESTTLSLKLVGASSSSSKSAFHVNPSIAVPDLNQSNSSPIHAV